MTPIEERILIALRQLNREIGRAFSYDVAAEVDGPVRTVRYHLARLEKAGRVSRPAGPRMGWVAG